METVTFSKRLGIFGRSGVSLPATAFVFQYGIFVMALKPFDKLRENEINSLIFYKKMNIIMLVMANHKVICDIFYEYRHFNGIYE